MVRPRTSHADDESWEAVGADLLAQIRMTDPSVADGDDSFWAVAAEELGYGTHARPHPPRPTGLPQAERSRTQLMLSMTEQRRDAAFTADQWRRLTSIADVTVAPPLDRLAAALDAMSQVASLRGRPEPRPDVLVGDGWTGELASLLQEKLPTLRLVCQLVEPGTPPPPPAQGLRVVLVDADNPVPGILAALTQNTSPAGHDGG
ncbi:hypothetical protein ACQSSU_25100 [Micromonospora echinospora]